MISEFQGKRRIFTFPKAWANAVVRWIAGVHSPNGTMEISNTLNPGDDGSLGLDVNLDAVVDKVKVRLGFDKRSPLDRNDVRDIVFDLLDGASVINSGRRVAVNLDWLNANIGQGEGGGAVSSVNGKTGAVVLTASDVGAAYIDTVSDLVDIVDGIAADYLDSSDIGSTVAEIDHTHAHTDISDWSTATSGFLTESDIEGYAIQDDVDLISESVEKLVGIVDDIVDDYVTESDLGNYVTTDTEQTLTATKYMSGAGHYFYAAAGEGDNLVESILGDGNVYLSGAYPRIEFRNTLRYIVGQYLCDSQSRKIIIGGVSQYNTWISNSVELGVAATDVSATNSLVVPTMGWVNDKFARKVASGTGFVTSTNGVLSIPEDQPLTASGNGFLKKNGTTVTGATISISDLPTGTSGTTVALGNHTHTDYAASNHSHTGTYAPLSHSHTGYAPSTTVSFPGFGIVAGKASEGNHTHGFIDSIGELKKYSGTSLVNANDAVVGTSSSGYIGAIEGMLATGLKKIYNAFTISTSDAKLAVAKVDFGSGVTNVTSSNFATIAAANGFSTGSTEGLVTTEALSAALASYALSTHTHGQYASTESLNALSGSVEELVGVVNGIVADYVTSADLTTRLSVYSTTSDINTQLANYALLTDLDDYLSVDEIPQNFITAIASRKSGNFTLITDIQFDGTNLQKKTQQITVTQGVITNIGTASAWSTWHTPTVITWS